MLNANEDNLILLFTRIHGEMTGSCYAEVVRDEEGEAAGVACMKGGQEAWRASLSELAADYAILHLCRQVEEAKP